MDKQLQKDIRRITLASDITIGLIGFTAGVIGSLLVQAVLS